MFSPSTDHEFRQPVSTPSIYSFDGLVTAEFDDGSANAAIALLQQLAREQAMENPQAREPRTYHRPYESSPPLTKVPPGEWRSLGGYFDYCHWADRDRFMELDRAIAASRHGQMFQFEADTELC